MKITQPKRKISCLSILLGLVGGFVILLVLVLVAAGVYQRAELARDRQRFPAPGRLVEVDGITMHINCRGEGSPTVVIDAGNGSYSLEWTPIQEVLSKTNRVCTYDRAGYGWSESGPAPRDGSKAVDELHALLKSAGEQGPYVLVGHSLGGLHARLYAVRYREELVGLVLVDSPAMQALSPAMEAQLAQMKGYRQTMQFLTGSGILRLVGPLMSQQDLPEAAQHLPASLAENYLLFSLDPTFFATADSEMQHFSASLDLVNEVTAGEFPLGDLPLVVLTAGQIDLSEANNPVKTNRVPVEAQTIADQQAMALLSTRGESRLIADSGHMVHFDRPEAVIQAIQDVMHH